MHCYIIHLYLILLQFFSKYNNNQAFYSQASWGRLEMKPHEPKKNLVQNKSETQQQQQPSLLVPSKLG